MITKIFPVVIWLQVVGLIALLILLPFESRSGSDPSTPAIGNFVYLLVATTVVGLVILNLLAHQWTRYVGIVLGLVAILSIIIVCLTLSGSSLIF